MSTGRWWRPADDARLRREYPRGDTAALAAALGRSVQAVLNRACTLGLRKAPDCIRRGKPAKQPWTAAEDRLLRRDYANTVTAAIASQLGRTPSSVYQRARVLGLAKSDAFLASVMSGRMRPGGDLPGAACRFKAGNTPWNAGRKGWTAGGDSHRFRFKRGQMPHNHKPIGSLRIADGYLQRKVTDTGYPPRDWVAVHRLVWQAAHGQIPPGHAVAFKPGRHTTYEAALTLDALELVSRRELMARNTRHANYPPELNRLIQLRGALNRKINNRTRQHEKHRS